MNQVDKILLGDNQFFGVNHLSSDKGMAKEIHFQNMENIIQVMQWALEFGATGIMLSTNRRIGQVCKVMKEDNNIRNNMSIYANIPDIAKYVRDANENGILGVLSDISSRVSLKGKMQMILRGGKNLIKRDYFDLLKTFIDMEMSYFSGLKVKAVFLHNILTDLALGLDSQGVFEFFAEYIEKKYKAMPGFGTLNLPMLVSRLNGCGITNALIMASFNKKGLYMNPSKKSYEECVAKYDFPLLANGVLASGALKPKEAFDYVFSHKPDMSCIIGASSRDHLEESINLLKDHLYVFSKSKTKMLEN